jgi:hypothetical protein
LCNAELALDGFKKFRIDRRGSKGGVLLLYIHEGLVAVDCTERDYRKTVQGIIVVPNLNFF